MLKICAKYLIFQKKYFEKCIYVRRPLGNKNSKIVFMIESPAVALKSSENIEVTFGEKCVQYLPNVLYESVLI